MKKVCINKIIKNNLLQYFRLFIVIVGVVDDNKQSDHNLKNKKSKIIF